MRQAKDIMTENPTCCTPEQGIRDAARIMKEVDCGCVPVVEGNGRVRLVGVITDRDICLRAVEPGRDIETTTVGECMSRDPACCGPDADLAEVERLMQERQVRRIPIIDGDGNIMGMVSQADLAVHGWKERQEVDERELSETLERISEPARPRSASSPGVQPSL